MLNILLLVLLYLFCGWVCMTLMILYFEDHLAMECATDAEVFLCWPMVVVLFLLACIGHIFSWVFSCFTRYGNYLRSFKVKTPSENSCHDGN